MHLVRTMRVVGMLVALLWAPITSHCLLETIPGLEFLHCESEADTPESQDCAEDVCQVVESGDYRVQDNSDLLEFLALAVTFPTAGPQPIIHLLNFPSTRSLVFDCSSRWQFLCRTALLPRAPCFAS